MSVVLLALGAALVWGTTGHVRGVALTIAGVAFIALGVAGSVLSLAYRLCRGRHAGRARDERLVVDA
jgi:hypothetical protein